MFELINLLYIWLAWCGLHLLAMLFARPNQPSFNGFRVMVPPRLTELLTEEELLAIFLHEYGHRHHWHIWKNYALVCCFLHASPERRQRQELEADDFAAAHGARLDLASALRKLSPHATDIMRAQRLELKCVI